MNNELKVHVALNVNAFDKSVQFYRALFGLEPVKLKPGYAKFDVSEPALNLTLNHVGPITVLGALNHLGVQVNSTEAVLEAKQRLLDKGLATFEEMDTDCCYALQDKIWITDPNGYRWEIFVVKVADTPQGLSQSSEESASPVLASTSCCAPTCCASKE